MKKLLAIAVVAAVVAGTSRAQRTNILLNQELTITGKLSPSGTAVTGASLSGNDSAIAYLQLQIVNGTTTNEESWIGQAVGSTTNLFLKEVANVDLTPNATKSDKWINVFASGDQVGTSSNAVLLIAGSQKFVVSKGATNNVFSAKVTGVWLSESDSGGGQSIAGSIASVKAK